MHILILVLGLGSNRRRSTIRFIQDPEHNDGGSSGGATRGQARLQRSGQHIIIRMQPSDVILAAWDSLSLLKKRWCQKYWPQIKMLHNQSVQDPDEWVGVLAQAASVPELRLPSVHGP